MALLDSSLVKKPKTISILGSTGVIGKKTLEIIRMYPHEYNVIALTAGSNVECLYKQALEFKPQIIIINDKKKYKWLANKLYGSGINVDSGLNGLLNISDFYSEFVMAAIVGSAGLLPTISALQNCKTLALANKECLVSAGDIFMKAILKYKVNLLPVDSEHNAIFQVLDKNSSNKVNRIILTASGGPFRLWPMERVSNATPEEALMHPNWKMGRKISIDSATMINKGFELIEAHHLFGFNEDKIDIVIHPESIVHSLVEFIDGSTIAQLGKTDMKIPIAYTLGWPNRITLRNNGLDFNSKMSLNFDKPDVVRFPALKLSREVLKAGGNASTILNSANEIAVERFLRNEIGYLDIIKIIDFCLNNIPNEKLGSIDDVISIDHEARELARSWSA